MSICCSNPAIQPNYRICFPNQQIIPDGSSKANPYYDFERQVSYWTYTIEIDPGGSEIKDLSNWVLQVCPDISVYDIRVEVSQDDQIFIPISQIEIVSLDPPTGITNVLKIDRPQSKGTTLIYRITIHNTNYFDLAAEVGTIAIKAGTRTFLFNENSCLHALPTPSIECIRVHRPHQNAPPILTLTKRCPKHDTVIYSVGDAITINLEVTNPGLTDVTGVNVLDQINIPSGVVIGGVITDPIATVVPMQPTYTNENILFTWTGLSIPPGVTSLAIRVTVVDAPIEITFIRNLDAGIEVLSGTDNYACSIAVYHTVQEHTIHCDLQLCLLFKSSLFVNLLIPSYGHCSSKPYEMRNKIEKETIDEIRSIECIRALKIFDSCSQSEIISRNTTVPFPQLSPGDIIPCRIHDVIMCEILEHKELNQKIMLFKLIIYVTLILEDPYHPSIDVIRQVVLFKTVELYVPSESIIDCSDSQPISCFCIVIQ